MINMSTVELPKIIEPDLRLTVPSKTRFIYFKPMIELWVAVTMVVQGKLIH